MAIGRGLAIVLRPFGVDRERFLALLHARLTADFARSRRAGDDGRPRVFQGGLALTLFMHLMIGLALGAALNEIDDPRVGLFLVFAAIMALVTMTLMGEHAGTLFETDDAAVLGPLPVDGRTVLAARVAHALTYFLFLVGSLALPPLLLGPFRFGFLFVPVFALVVVLASATCLAAGIVLLLITLRWCSARVVRNALLLMQIAASVGAMVGWQLLPRLAALPNAWISAPDAWAPWLLPPAHAGALVLRLLGATGDAQQPQPPLVQALLAIVLPALLLAVIAGHARSFQERLLAMLVNDRPLPAPKRRRFWRDLLLRDREAILAYDFAAALTAREQVFRMRVWPMLAIAWFFSAWWSIGIARRSDPSPAMACAGLYMIGVTAPQVLTCARFSEHWRARHVFTTNPLQRPGLAVGGAMLALLLRFCVPALALTFAITLAIGGLGILHDAAFALLAAAAMTLIALRTEERRLPFTEQFAKAAVEGTVVRSLLFFLLAGVFAALHAVLRRHPLPFVAATVLLALFVGLLLVATNHTLRNPRHVGLAWRHDDA
jgi:ABC-2 type transport system permease protein